MFPEKQKRGFKVHRDKENQILEALLKGRALPGLFASQTPKGVQILGGGSGNEANALYATLSGTTIYVTSGFINGTEIPVMDGDTLDTIPAPTLTIGTLPFFVCLRVEWLPNADGVTPDFYASGVASFDSITVVGEDTSVPAVTTPTVNATTGAVTQNGIAYFVLAEWVDDGDANPILSSRNSGHRWFTVCGADEAKFVWNGQ